MQPTTCAMYIDGDGMPFWLMEQAVADARSRYADVRVRAYKDWTDPHQQHLVAALWGIGVDLVQVKPHARLRNATDIAIAVDAVDTVHRTPADAVALVANDGDFTTLVEYLGHRGVETVGYGTRSVSGALRQACHQFIRFDPITRMRFDGEAPASPVEELVARTVTAYAGSTGWTTLATFGHAILVSSGLRPSDVGVRTWSRYFARHHGFDCARDAAGIPQVRVRPPASSTAAEATALLSSSSAT